MGKDEEIGKLKEIIEVEKKKLNELKATSDELSRRPKTLENSSKEISLKELKSTIEEEKRKQIDIKSTPPNRKRKVSSDGSVSVKKSKASELSKIQEKSISYQAANRATNDDSNDASSGLRLLTNIDLFTSSLSSARKEIESSSVFISLEEKTASEHGDHDKNVAAEDTSLSKSKTQQKLTESENMSVEEKMRLLFEEDSSGKGDEVTLNEKVHEVIVNEKVDELPVSYSPAKTSKVSKVAINSLPVKPKIYLKDQKLLSWNPLWPENVDINKRDRESMRHYILKSMDDISKEEYLKINKDTNKFKRELVETVTKCVTILLPEVFSTEMKNSIFTKNLMGVFVNEFRDDIFGKYLKKCTNLSGIELSRKDKGDIMDKIILFSSIKKMVENEMKNIPLLKNLTQFSLHCLKLTKEIYCKIDSATDFVGENDDLNRDLKLQITNLVSHSFSQVIEATKPVNNI